MMVRIHPPQPVANETNTKRITLKPGFDFTGISVVGYCNDGKGRFLLHKRGFKARDERGRWDVVAGRLKFHEDPVRGVLREVWEEYGCRGLIQEQLHPYSASRIMQRRRTHWIALPFFILIDPTEVRNREPMKITEFGWFRLGAFPSPLHSMTKFSLTKYAHEWEKYGRQHT